MKGDFSRSTFHREKHYSGVLMQQGRVQLDADWNEQQAINQTRVETEARDVIGPCGAPQIGGGFEIGATPDGSDLTISPGRIYVDGILCELESTPIPIRSVSPQDKQVQVADWIVDGLEFAKSQWVAISADDQTAKSRVEMFRITKVNPQQFTLTLDTEDTGRLAKFQAANDLQLRRTTTYTTQPDYPAPEPKLASGTYLVYLDVWQRHITALDDPLIREKALGGPDTTTRIKTVWQVKVMPLTMRLADPEKLKELQKEKGDLMAKKATLEATGQDPSEIEAQLQKVEDKIKKLSEADKVTCDSSLPEWEKLLPISTGRLNARTRLSDVQKSPCLLPPTAGYQRLENQLYRVEVHRGGPLGEATFKWSRDNGTVVTTIEKIDGQEITVQGLGPDDVLGFASGQWVELLDDRLELNGKPGQLAQIAHVNTATRVITLKSAVEPLAATAEGVDKTRHPKLRRWDQTGTTATADGVKMTPDWVALADEDGIEVQFSDDTYKTGDYWLIPARTATGDIEWPPYEIPNTNPIPQPPLGIQHHYCRLALVTIKRTMKSLFDVVKPMGHSARYRRWTLTLEPDVRWPGGTPLTAEDVKNVLDDNRSSIPGYRESTVDAHMNTIRVWFSRSDERFVDKLKTFRVFDELLTEVTPCRRTFPPLTAITANDVSFDDSVCQMGAETVQGALEKLCQRSSDGHGRYLVLRYVGGDGQEGRPNETLPCTLAVGVEDENGLPVADVPVNFEAMIAGDILKDFETSGNTSNEIYVNTNDKGIAQVWWVLGEEELDCRRVVARLETPPQPGALPIHFKATIREIDAETETWPTVKETSWTNDQPLSLTEFKKGLTVSFSHSMNPNTASLDTFIVTLELPTLEPPYLELVYAESGFDGLEEKIKAEGGYAGHRIFIVPGTVKPNDEEWTFIPQQLDDDYPDNLDKMLGIWLVREQNLLVELVGMESSPIRCRVVLKGNTILDTQGRPLDGDTFGVVTSDSSGNRYIALDFHSGDGVKGGDFESWFYLVPDEQ